jgi:hypothetical protein
MIINAIKVMTQTDDMSGPCMTNQNLTPQNFLLLKRYLKYPYLYMYINWACLRDFYFGITIDTNTKAVRILAKGIPKVLRKFDDASIKMP